MYMKQTKNDNKVWDDGCREVLRNQLHSSEKCVEGEGQTGRKRTMKNRYTSRARVIAKERKRVGARTM